MSVTTVLPAERTGVASSFFCEHAAAKSRVFAFVDAPGLTGTLHAVLTCTDRLLAHRVAAVLTRLAADDRPDPQVTAAVEEIATELPHAPAASFRQAVRQVTTYQWPIPWAAAVRIADLVPDSWAPARAALGPLDFATLFPVEPGDEVFQLTPRTADILMGSLGVLRDDAAVDVSEHGSLPVADEVPGFVWDFFDRLPTLSWGQDATWRRQFVRAAEDLQDDLAAGRWPTPRCNAEELILHLAIEDAVEQLEETGDDARHNNLPRHGDDYDWGGCSGAFFQDHDILNLFDDELGDIANPENPVNRAQGIGDLRPDTWFELFDNLEPRASATGD